MTDFNVFSLQMNKTSSHKQAHVTSFARPGWWNKLSKKRSSGVEVSRVFFWTKKDNLSESIFGFLQKRRSKNTIPFFHFRFFSIETSNSKACGNGSKNFVCKPEWPSPKTTNPLWANWGAGTPFPALAIRLCPIVGYLPSFQKSGFDDRRPEQQSKRGLGLPRSR